MKRFDRSLGLAAMLVSTLGISVAAHATTIIDTRPEVNGTIRSFGTPGTMTYGETFTVGADNVLQTFGLQLSDRSRGDGTLDLIGYIGLWDGTKATSILYTSSTRTMNAAGTLQEFDFDTGGLSLTAGQQYVAFLSTSALPSQNSSFAMPTAPDSAYSGGNFVFFNNTTFDQLTTQAWNGAGIMVQDVAFVATFDAPAAAVPEPGSIALLGLGVLGLAAQRRRRSK